MSTVAEKKLNFFEKLLAGLVFMLVSEMPHNQKDAMVKKTKAYVNKCATEVDYAEYVENTLYELYRGLIDLSKHVASGFTSSYFIE